MIQELFSDRIGGNKFGTDTNIYKFEKIKIAKREAISKNPNTPLIDLGVGEPDSRADDQLIDVLNAQARKSENRYYSDNGIDDLKGTIKDYMARKFDVSLSTDQINHVIGSKTALAMLPLAFINLGDVAILTIPGYPVLGTHTKYLGGSVYNIELKEENNFLPDLSSIPADICKKAKFLYLNYPNNPTGALAPVEFFKEAIAFAKKHSIIIVHDAAYIELTYDKKQPSILSIDGAMDVAIEIHSFSKSFNMTGWRLGWICGNTKVVNAFKVVKDNSDSGAFIPIQLAGSYGLKNSEELIKPTREKYKRRLTRITAILNDLGFNVKQPEGTFYLYFKSPKGTQSGMKFNTAEDFSQYLIKEKLISSVPWDDVGNYLRFTCCFEATLEQEEEILSQLENRLKSETYVF